MAERAGSGAVLWGLVAVNVAVHVAWLTIGRGSDDGLLLMRDHFVLSLDAVARGRVWTLITAAFSHLSTEHLLFNLLALWVFGDDVLERVGGRRFVGLYLVGGLVSSVGHLVYQLVAGSDVGALGASGAVMAISVVFAALFPRRTLLVMLILPMPAVLAVALYVVLDLWGALSPMPDNVAHAAHLGGAAYGFVYWWLFLRRRRPE